MSDVDETKTEGNVKLDIKRNIKLTTKALEKIDEQMNLRKCLLARCVSKAEEIDYLIE